MQGIKSPATSEKKIKKTFEKHLTPLPLYGTMYSVARETAKKLSKEEKIMANMANVSIWEMVDYYNANREKYEYVERLQKWEKEEAA